MLLEFEKEIRMIKDDIMLQFAMKIEYNILLMPKKQFSSIFLLIILSICISNSHAISAANLELTDSNMGADSTYIFSFIPMLSYSIIDVVITFPIQYSVSSFAGALQCYFSTNGNTSQYEGVNCQVEADKTANMLYLLGSVAVSLASVNSTSPNFILFKNVINPTVKLSSNFQVCIRKNGVNLECNNYFGRAVFSQIATVTNAGISIVPVPNPAYVARESSLSFKFAISNQALSYSFEKLRIRVILPSDYLSDSPLCSLLGYGAVSSNQQFFNQIPTNILPLTPNEIDCGPVVNLTKWLGLNNQLQLKVEHLINPFNSNAYQNFKVQIVRDLYMQPIQTITFPSSIIQISPQNLIVSINQTNYMRNSTNVYYFLLNHFTDLNQSSSIKVEFLQGNWKINSTFAVRGFTSPSTLQYLIQGNNIILYNYGNAFHFNQQIFGINLTSTLLAGTYEVRVSSLLFGNVLGTWLGNVTINGTIGSLNFLSISAVQAATKLPVNKTGPLEFHFFLNYEIPPSGDTPNGSLIISIQPQIPQPDPIINGALKCYWAGTRQAANCDFDDASQPNKTIITLLSPPHDSFKYSEIPVIITTEGGRSESDLGLTINPLVVRYKFSCHFYLYNSSQIPSQVFFTTWVADAIPMTTVTAVAFTHQCNEYTHLQVKFNMPLLDQSIPKEYRIKVQFQNADGSGWAKSVGYAINQIYQRYPCVVVGLPGVNIHCDLYTYYEATTPYNNMHINNDVTGPYLLIYGFEEYITLGTLVRIEIPKIKLGSVAGSTAKLGLSILEETPGQVEPYIQLYYQSIQAFTTLPAISMSLTPVISSQAMPIYVQTYNQYHIAWPVNNTASAKYITYEMSPSQLPSLVNQDGVCLNNACVGLGEPANWIVQYPTTVSSPHTLDTLLQYVQSMKFVPSIHYSHPITIFTYDANGRTLDKYQMNFEYNPQLITGASFDFEEPIAYAGLPQWYSISFVNPNNSLSNYPFARFVLADGLSYNDPPQCNSTTLIPFNQSGLICQLESPQSMRVKNFKNLAAYGSYNIWFKLHTTAPVLTAPISPIVNILINHNNSIDASIVSDVQNLMLSQAPYQPILGAPQQFCIHNPQIMNEDIRIGYIGPVYIQFTSKTTGTYDIDVQFANHRYNGGYWRTPNTDNLDPTVCMLNQIRCDCSPTNLPLKVSISKATVNSGINNLRLDTEYIPPYNGIKYPDVAGMYSIKLSFIANGTTNAITIYAQVNPPKFLHMQAGSIVRDINTESVYKLNLTLPSTFIYPNSYFDTVNRSRIIIQFPTVQGNVSVFSPNLGGYNGIFQERVGCFFPPCGSCLTFVINYTLQCRLIPSEIHGDPIKVQVINYDAFSPALNSFQVYIFRVWNPILALSSVPITVKIDHIQVATGNIYPLYKQTYRVFIDPNSQNTNPTIYPSVDDPSVRFFQNGLDVGDYGPIVMTAQTVSGLPITQPFYMLVKLPKFLNPQNNQTSPSAAFPLCPSPSFVECVSVPEINYLMIQGTSNISQFMALIKNYPLSISRSDSLFYTNIIENGRFAGILEYNISAAFRWQQIIGKIVLNYCQATGLQSKIVKSKNRFQLSISFTTTNFIPEKGSIEIGFPPSVGTVFPHCRSSVQLGSMLVARVGTSGQIGCMVQNNNKWVISGFADVAGGATIIIQGEVNLPPTNSTIGTGQIITYADADLVDIHTNGSIIDYLQKDFNLILINSLAMNPIEDIFMTQRTVLRAGYTGEFRILLKSDLALTVTDSVTLRMGINDIKGTAGGFTASTRPTVCEFVRIDTNQQIGCKVASIGNDGAPPTPAIFYVLQSVQNLLANVDYEIRLTTQSYSEPAMPEGIPYPATAGQYKVQTITTISSINKTQHRYIQIYGPSFSQLLVTQYNYLAGQYNLLWVQFIPATPISTKHQIIVEFPTLSSNGTALFDNNLGLLQYKDGEIVPVDIFDSLPLDNGFMTCRIYFGDRIRSVPVRLICGNLASTLPINAWFRFAFGFYNPALNPLPTIPTQLSLPIMVYSFDPILYKKYNFNLVNAAVYVYNQQSLLSPNGYFNTLSGQLQYQNDSLIFGDAHTNQLVAGDAFVLKFAFPLRMNGKYNNYCQSTNGLAATGTYGHAYYHWNLRIIVCKVIAGPVPSQVAPTAATMMISGFYTPWYSLTTTQRIVMGIATYASTSTSEVINYFDPFPLLAPRYQFPTSLSTLTLNGVLNHNIACQADDYIFRINLESVSATNTDLSWCGMVSINLPPLNVLDFDALNTDCVEYIDSQIQLLTCRIDMVARILYMTIVQFHQLTLYYGSNYISLGNQKLFDLSFNNPVCYLHNTRVQYCYINPSNNSIYMLYNFDIPGGRPVHVYFSVLDPRQPQNNGFSYIGSSNIDNLLINMTLSTGTTYIFETGPFVAKETQVGGVMTALPQRGIKLGSIDWATNIVGQLNVIDMTFNVNRTDITALQFTIPLLDQLNRYVYMSNTLSAFFNINDGGQYPCGNNNPGVGGTGTPLCYIYNGDNTELGFPTIITMFNFRYTGGVIKARLILYNPDLPSVWFTIKVKAFSGTPSAQTLFGSNYVGYWNFPNVFQTINVGVPTYTASNQLGSYYLGPDKGPWRQYTTWSLFSNTPSGANLVAQPAGLGGYAIVKVPINNYNLGYADQELCKMNFPIGNADSDDMLILKSKQSNYETAFFIKKWATSPWLIRYFKCKHYGQGFVSYMYPSQTVMEINNQIYVVSNQFQPYTPNLAIIDYFEDSRGRVVMQFDVTSMMNTIYSQGFIEENKVRYQLQFYLIMSPSTWTSAPSKCYVIGGFLNNMGETPTCSVTSLYYLTVQNFQKIMARNLDGRYVIKVELVLADPGLNSASNALSSYIWLYANSDANGITFISRQYIAYTYTSNSYTRSIIVRSSINNIGCGGAYYSTTASYTDTPYSSYLASSFDINVQTFTLDALNNLHMIFTLNPVGSPTFMMSGWSTYAYFRFYVEGFDYACSTISQMILTYTRSGVNYPINFSGRSGVTCSGTYFEVDFYIAGIEMSSWGWGSFTSFLSTDSIKFDAIMPITPVFTGDVPYLRDWIGIRSSVHTFYYRYCCYWTYCGCCWNEYYSYHSDLGVTDQLNTYFSLASSLSIGALAKNINMETQFYFTLSGLAYQIGEASVDKLLLLQFNTATHPFNYINATINVYNYKLECRCIVSSTGIFDPANTVTPSCYLRLPQVGFSNFAITVNIDVPATYNVQCYFPGWFATSTFAYRPTAKLINKGTSTPPDITTTSLYGGYYKILSGNSLPFSASPAMNPISIVQNPPIYSTVQYVNTPYTSSYTLTLTTISNLINPIIYINFQQGGLVPDQTVCPPANGFLFCRTYNTEINVIVAQFGAGLGTNSVSFIKSFINLLFPKHKEYLSNYDMVVSMASGGAAQYTQTSTLIRDSTQLLLTPLTITVNPEPSTSTNMETYRTDLLISFNQGGQILFSTPIYGSQIVISSSVAVLSVNRGCTARAVDNPDFILDCKINGGLIYITNPSYTSTLSVSGLIQVIVGIVNPSTAFNWYITSYQYYYSPTNYGKQGYGTVVYTPNNQNLLEQRRTQIRMLPFYTKIYSNVQSAYRMVFKYSLTPSLPVSINYLSGFRLVMQQFTSLSSFTNFECQFKQFTTEPLQAPQAFLPNAYRNYKQHTQYIPNYAYCTYDGVSLVIEPPRDNPLTPNTYYELIIMPTGVGLTQTGFNDGYVSNIKLMTYPGSCEHIDEWPTYNINKFSLNAIYLVTYRPLATSALMIQFSILSASNYLYPNHYLEIYFQDINYNSIKPPYNQVGARVPCILSSQFVTAGRTKGPTCIVNYMNAYHGDLVLRVTEIGNLPVSNTYNITLDNFIVPDLSTLLEQTNPFSVCLRLHVQATSPNTKYQRCFQEIFVMDGFTNTNPVISNTGIFINPPQNSFATQTTGKLQFNYPMTTASPASVDQKSMTFINGGYAATSPPPISFGAFNILWYNPEINMYILEQPTSTATTPTNVTLSGLVNPSAYQMADYSNVNNIQMTFYDGYHPNNDFTFNQPPFSFFTPLPSLVGMSNVYVSDIRNTIPTNTPCIVKMGVNIQQSVAMLTTNKDNLFEITFDTSAISKLQQCWIGTTSTSVPYRGDGWCQTTSDNRILLYNFYESNVNYNLTIYVKLYHLTTSIIVSSKLYSSNGQVQFNNINSYSNTKIDLASVGYSLLSFTQNVYTNYYFEQAIIPLTMSTPCKYMYFSLNIPQDMIFGQSIFNIYLPTTIMPANTSRTQQICEWLEVDRYNRQFDTGVYSYCNYTMGLLNVYAPFANMPALSITDLPIKYLLKIRQFDIINTLYVMPNTAKPEEIELATNNSNTFTYDSLIIHPYQHFNLLSQQFTTLSVNQLNTYHIQFVPTANIDPGYDAVLQISVDNRYLVQDLGMPQLYSTWGVDYGNSTRIDNLNYNIQYDILNNIWRNGAPYSCWTSTKSQANNTNVHTGKGYNSKRVRVTHLLETAYTAGTKYIWKIPLLLNPSALNTPFRMNVTLWTFHTTGFGVGQKELFYQIINSQFTQPNAPTLFTYTIPNNNFIQSTSANISILYSASSVVPSANQFAQLKLNNQLVSLVGISDLLANTQTDTSYTFYFFPRINMLLGLKKITDGVKLMNLGNMEMTNQYADYVGYDWVKTHSNLATIRQAGPVSRLTTSCVITSMDVYAIAEGIGTARDSQFLLEFGFTNSNCYIPTNSTLAVNYDSNVLSALVNSNCEVNFREYSCMHYPGQVQITFNQFIPLGTSIIARTYLRTVGTSSSTFTITGYIFGIPNVQFTKVIDFPSIGTIPSITDSFIDYSQFQHIQINYLYENTQMDIRGNIAPRQPLTYIDFTHPFPQSLTSQARMIIRTNSTSPYYFDYSSETKWVQDIQTTVSDIQAIQTTPFNGLLSYNLNPNQEYTFIMESTYDLGGINNMTVGPVGSFYLFKYQTSNQIAYDEVYPIPVAEQLTVINPFTIISQQTALGFQFVVSKQNIAVGNRITIQLDTVNLRYDMFRVTSNYEIQCVEKLQGILTTLPQLICETIQRPTLAKPNQALIVAVYPQLAVPMGTLIQIWLSPIFNPSVIMVSGATVRVDIDCGGEQRCVIYESRGYYRTTPNMNLTTAYTETFSATPPEVLAKGATHTFSLLSDTYNTFFVKYPENYNTVMPTTCIESAGNICLVFPKQKKVMAVLPNVTTTSLVLNGMINGIYVQPQNTFDIIAATPSSVYRYFTQHGNLTTRQYIPQTAVSTWMTITPTQTPNLFLRKWYWNVANFTIYGLYSTLFVKAFYLNAPVEIVTWDTTYCNATFQSLNNDPYPTRLLCSFINQSTIQVLIPEGVPEIYMTNITQQFLMTIHAKFFIADFPPNDGILYVSQPDLSHTFNAYGSFNRTNMSYEYYITEAWSPINISQHRVPIIGDAAFNTQSFVDREAEVNENTTFQLLIDPITTEPIARLELVIPSDFGYPDIGVHDACQLITTAVTNISQCYQYRRDNQTIISTNLPSAYDNGPRILKLASNNQTNWFVSPDFPGSWYNMTVLLYSANGTLLEAQTTQNSSEVSGYDIDIQQMVVTNGLDENMNQIVDVSFVVGDYSIPKGYSDGLSYGQFYTYIKLTFQNLQAFDNNLGLNITDGQLVGCVTNGLFAFREISCTLHIGFSAKDEPYIAVEGYQPIAAKTNVTISIANILNMLSSEVNTVTVAVVLHRIGYTESVNLYDEGGKVLMITSPLQTAKPTQLFISYVPPLIAHLPTTLNFTITPSIDINSYFVLKFPQYGLHTEYSLFNLSCTLASKIDIYYRANIVRLYPSATHLANTSRSYIITGFPSPAYAIGPTQFNVTVQSYSNLKQANSQVYSINNMQVKRCSISLAVLAISTVYTYDTQVIYTLQFAIPLSASTSSNSLTVAIGLPSQYGDIRQAGALCSMDTNATCRLLQSNYVEITGTRETGKLIHTLTLSNINNPSTLTNIFTIKSYDGDSAERVVCYGETTVTLISSSLESCSLEVVAEHQTKGVESMYHFGITCSNVIRNNSILLVNISNNYAYSGLAVSPCYADNRYNLLATTCSIVYINGSYYLQVTNVTISNNEKTIGINVVMKNPIVTGNYTMAVSLLVNNYIYAVTNIDFVNIFANTVNPMQSLQLINIPTEAGEQAYYIFRVPTASLNSSLAIDFPTEFELPSQTTVQIFSSDSSTWASTLAYSDILNVNGLSLPSIISQTNSLSYNLYVGNTSNGLRNAGAWTYIIVQPIPNPAYQSQSNFQLSSYYELPNAGIKLLTSTASTPLEYELTPPSSDIIQTNISVADNDVLFLTTYSLTYRLSTPLQTNLTNIYIYPPVPSLNYALTTLNCCITINSSTNAPLEYCSYCTIIDGVYKFDLPGSGWKIPADVDFVIKLVDIYNPPNATDCTLFAHHLLSYFQIKIFRNDQTVSHSQVPPTNLNSPCQPYIALRADIIVNLPSTLYTGFVHNFSLSLSQPTKMLRVDLLYKDNTLVFNPSTFFFDSYDTTELYGQIKVSSLAIDNNQTYVNITHEQSGSYDTFRPNLPIPVNIVSHHTEYVIVQESKAITVGYEISIPITITLPSSTDMLLEVTTSPNDPNLIFNTSQILLTAYSSKSQLIFKYIGDVIPPTINLTLSLVSQYPLNYQLTPTQIYLYFSQSSSYKTLPPVMQVQSMYNYLNNSQFAGRKIYNINHTNFLYYDKLLPQIISVSDQYIGSTSASLLAYTREECTVAYVMYQYGDHFIKAPRNAQSILNSINISRTQSVRNISNVINPYASITFNGLQEQTQYFVYLMAYSSVGNSLNISVHSFTTEALSNAMQFKLTTNSFVITDEVLIVKTLSDILKIDANRIKVVSSQKLINQTFSNTTNTNAPQYQHTIVISPSITNDQLSVSQLLSDRLFNNLQAQQRLRQLIPNWTGTFNASDTILLNRPQPIFRQTPNAVRISYYNATFRAKLWNRARIHAILLEYFDKTQDTLNYTQQKISGTLVNISNDPTIPKQITRGRDSNNQQAPFYYTSLTNSQGEVSIIFTNLQPGSQYILYATATSPQIYQPIIYSSQVSKTIFYTLWNPNLHNTEKLLLQQFKKFEPQMYQAIKDFYDNQQKKLNMAKFSSP